MSDIHSDFQFDDNTLMLVREKPHLLGYMVGKDFLTDLHSYWIKYIWDSTEERCLQAHRESGKTTAIVAIGTIYWLLFHPDDRIGIIRKTWAEAAKVTTVISEMMKNSMIRELFRFAHGYYPEFKIDRTGYLTFIFKSTLTPEGNINAYGIHSIKQGTHLEKVNLDDFVDKEDRYSQAEREKTKNSVREIRTNIISTIYGAGFIGTPWHKDDAWSILPKPLTFDVYECKILDKEQIELKRTKTTPSLYSINYELKHIPDENKLFIDPVFGRWKFGADHHKGVYGHIDGAYGGDCSTALTFFAELKENNNLQGWGKCFWGHVKNCYDVIEAEYRRRGCIKIYIEDNADKGFLATDLRKRGMRVEEYHENENKHVKISTFLYDRWKDIIWDSGTDPEYMIQITEYEKDGKPDDACFIAGTKIMTLFGEKNIEFVKTNDYVLTPFGFKKVLFSGCTGVKKVITKIGLTGTYNHKIYNKNKNRFAFLDSLTTLLSCDILSLRGLLKWRIKKLLFLTGKNILKREDIIFVTDQAEQKGSIILNCIEQFGNFIITKRYLKGFIFIIKILIQGIMTFLIWNWLKIFSICQYMRNILYKMKNIEKKIERNYGKHKKKRKNGIEVKKEKYGIKNMLLNLLKKHGILGKKEFVFNVKKNILQNILNNFIVPINVEADIEVRHMENINNVVFVEKKSFLKRVLVKIQNIVQTLVNIKTIQEGEEKKKKKKVKVYNLQIENIGVYYANNILVSNCDSAASLIRAKFRTKSGDDTLWEV